LSNIDFRVVYTKIRLSNIDEAIWNFDYCQLSTTSPKYGIQTRTVYISKIPENPDVPLLKKVTEENQLIILGNY
jgi:hypothetical protein